MTDADREAMIDALIRRMTTAEKVHLCHGIDDVFVGDIPRLGIPKLGIVDGPQGVRLEDGRTATALPCGISLACSWSPEAAEEFGALIGREVLAAGLHASAGPGMNLMRTPLNGRNFEYYGEDPVLSGHVAAGYIRGCQAEGAAAMPKHLALNNQEICRGTGSSNVDERTLRELYLRGFEIAVREGRPWAMMSSYNKINGVHASACRLVQQQIVKDEFGFDGVMVSDWGGAHDTMGCALGGLDLEMGYGRNPVMGEAMLEKTRSGMIPEAVVEDKVRRILRMMFRTGRFLPEDSRPKGEINTPRHRQLARRMAQEGMVLLKNEGGLLPFDAARIKTLAVIGPNADYAHSMGPLEVCGGSGAVHPEYEITPLEGLRDYCRRRRIECLHAPGLVFDRDAVIPPGLLSHDTGKPGLKAAYYRGPEAMAAGETPFLTRVDKDMRMVWNPTVMVGGRKQDRALPDRDFAARWEGWLTPDCDGPCSLLLDLVHAQARVWLDGALVVETAFRCRHARRGHSWTAEKNRPLSLTIEMRCLEPNPEMRLLWQSGDAVRREQALAAAARADAVVFCGGTHHGYDKEGLGWGDAPGIDIPDLELIGPQAELIRDLVEVNPRTAVVLTNGSVVSVETWIDRVPALLEIWYTGMEGGNALAEVLFGDANPSGKLCCTWGKRLIDYACHANGNYPGVRDGENPFVSYDEGVFTGYRHFDRAAIEPRFPFGFGLSYTTFDIRLLDCAVQAACAAAPRATVRVSVTNTGLRAGAEVVQLYVGDDACSVERPKKELKAFRKVWLKPGETRTVEFGLGWRDFAFWSPKARNWVVEPGRFTVFVGNSCGNLPERAHVELTEGAKA